MRHRYEAGSVDIAVASAPARGAAAELWPSVGEYPCYDPFLYHEMTDDAIRNRAFRRALSPWAPGRHVLDIGTGQDLNWALEAARLGARLVTAVEALPETYARALDRLAGCPEEPIIDLLCGSSFEVTIEERADVCVAELIGSIASAEGMLSAIDDAHKRLLRPKAVVVPAACDTVAAAVSFRRLFPSGPAIAPDAVPYLRRIFDLYGRAFDVRLTIANVDPEVVLSTTGTLERLTFDGRAPLEETTEVSLEITADGEIDGLLCWIRLSAGPGAPVVDSLRQRTSWIPAYLPLFDAPAAVQAGDTLGVRFSRRTSDDGVHPDYALDGTLTTRRETVQGSWFSSHHGIALGSAPIYRELLRPIGANDALDS